LAGERASTISRPKVENLILILNHSLVELVVNVLLIESVFEKRGSCIVEQIPYLNGEMWKPKGETANQLKLKKSSIIQTIPQKVVKSNWSRETKGKTETIPIV
jgi:hypothetical protein